jgi:hypothetical protein
MPLFFQNCSTVYAAASDAPVTPVGAPRKRGRPPVRRQIAVDSSSSSNDSSSDEEELQSPPRRGRPRETPPSPEPEPTESESSDSDEEEEEEEENWDRQRVYHSKRYTAGPCHATNPLPADAEPSDYFKQTWPEKATCMLVDQTNLYAWERQCEKAIEGGVTAAFEPDFEIEQQEMEAYLGTHMLMGTFPLVDLADYWHIKYGMECVREVFSRNRFMEISSNLHVVDNATKVDKTDPAYDKAWKVAPLYDVLNATWATCHHCGQYVTVDEGMVKMKNHIGFLQYNPSKPIKRGVKSWKAACSTCGFCVCEKIYTGKQREGDVDVAEQSRLGTRAVLSVTGGLTGKWRTIVTDNFFTSIQLADKLWSLKTLLLGTVRNHKTQLPREVHAMTVRGTERGDWLFGRYKGASGVFAVGWRDNKIVRFLSNAQDSVKEDTVLRRERKKREKTRFAVPHLQLLYQKHMRAVDRNDQYLAMYPLGQRHWKRWYLKLVFHMLDTAIVNAYLLFRASPHWKKNIKNHQFLAWKRRLAEQLIGGRKYRSLAADTRSPLTPPTTPPDHHHHQQHFLRLRSQRTCQVCREARPQYYCLQCDKQVCPAPCFERLHQQLHR